jgi:hypothetical protein
MDDEKPPAELGDDPFSISGLYRLASAEDRALIDEALSELLHTLDRMPGTADEPWLAEARHDAEDNQRAFREIRRAEAEQERNSSRPEDDDEGWVPVIIV